MDVQALIREAAIRHGVDPNYALKAAGIESSYNPGAMHPQSKAAGLYQFIPSTWSKYGNGANPLDAAANADAAMRFTKDNQRALRAALGRDPTPGETYLAHQQGAKGAADLLMNHDKPAGALVGLKAVAQNGGQLGMSARDFANKWTGRFDGMTAAGQPTVPMQTAGATPQEAPQMPQQTASSPLADAFATAAQNMSQQIAETGEPPRRRNPNIIVA